jgi:NitT/TauT family transport system substrate-binding protein
MQMCERQGAMNLSRVGAFGWIRPWLVSVLLMTALLGCSQKSAEPLRIGINPWPGYEFLYLAQEKGFFADENLPVRIVEFNSLADGLHAYERGQLDGWGCTMIELLIARSESPRKPQVVYIADYSDGADVILAKQEIADLTALKGKRVGLEQGSLGVFMLARALESVGMTLNDVITVSMDQMSGEAEMAQGTLDALVTYPPFSVRLTATDKFKAVFDSSQIKGEIVDVIAIHDEVIATRSDDVKKLTRAFRRAQAYALEHPDEAYGLMARREGISAEEFKVAITEGIHLPTYEEQRPMLARDSALVKALIRAEKVLVDTKQITRSATPEEAVSTAGL